MCTGIPGHRGTGQLLPVRAPAGDSTVPGGASGPVTGWMSGREDGVLPFVVRVLVVVDEHVLDLRVFVE